ncbi:AAA family ATPase [Brachybacterium sp. FME24]|uniref:phosphotransferase-like protein n=1 Tax=Brachybacterium sp. FME24 TaxID=2742605 RepID=UPI001866A336|nr:AAA family ATPase [Brachybacterium sp. FME24]
MTARILLISGASGTGKSSVAAALLENTTSPWVGVEADLAAPRVSASTDVSSEPGNRRFAETLLDSVVAWPAAGYDTIVDGILPYPVNALHHRFLERLAGFDLRILAMSAEEAAVRHRIAQRGRGDIAWSLRQLRDIHDGVPADFSLDTTAIAPGDVGPLRMILAWMNSPRGT